MLIAKDSWVRRFNRRRSTRRLLDMQWMERWRLDEAEKEEKRMRERQKEKRRKTQEQEARQRAEVPQGKEKMRATVWRWEGAAPQEQDKKD